MNILAVNFRNMKIVSYERFRVFIKVYYTIVDGQRVFCLFIALLTPSTLLLFSFKGD